MFLPSAAWGDRSGIGVRCAPPIVGALKGTVTPPGPFDSPTTPAQARIRMQHWQTASVVVPESRPYYHVGKRFVGLGSPGTTTLPLTRSRRSAYTEYTK